MYLIHMPCFYFVREAWHRYSGGVPPSQEQFVVFTVLATVLVLLLSELNYRFVEVPLRRRGSRIAQEMVPIAQKTVVTPGALQDAR